MDIPKKSELDKMTADELEDLLRAMNNEQAQRREAILDVHKVYDRKREAETALAKLGNLSEGEIEALTQAIESGAIPSRDDAERETREENS